MPVVTIDNKNYDVNLKITSNSVEAYTITEFFNTDITGFGSNVEEAIRNLKKKYYNVKREAENSYNSWWQRKVANQT